MAKRVYVLVSLENPGAKIRDLVAYVEDAVASMKGSYSPDDPVFGLDGDTVHATHFVLDDKHLPVVKQCACDLLEMLEAS